MQHDDGNDNGNDNKNKVRAQGADGGDISRRGFLRSSALGAVGVTYASQLAAATAEAHDGDKDLERLTRRDDRNRKVLLKGGVVLSMDPAIGDFERGDVLIAGRKIAAVGPNLSSGGAEIVDARNRIVLPGFVNTHAHMFQTNLRGYWSDALIGEYLTQSRAAATAVFHQYTPEDVYLGSLAGALCYVNEGITTGVDTSQSSYTPEHTDASVAAFRDSGLRTVFAYTGTSGGNIPSPRYAYPQDLRRLKTQYFSSSDQLVTLALGANINLPLWALARELGVPIISHAGTGPAVEAQLAAAHAAGAVKSDITYIHCLGYTDATWRIIKETGGKPSLTVYTDATLGQGYVALQRALDFGLPPSFGTDADSFGPSDLFTQMRAAYATQRGRIAERSVAGETNLPRYVNTKEILQMATIGGAQGAHLAHKVGSLTPGKEADIVLLSTDVLNASPLHHAAGAVVNFMDTSNVDSVFIAGKLVKWKGRLVGVDLNSILRRLTASGEALLKRAGNPRIVTGTCCTH